jgi:hypothetical protein
MAVWFVVRGATPALLRPLIGLPLRSKGKEWPDLPISNFLQWEMAYSTKA